jgi:hypothetical protein
MCSFIFVLIAWGLFWLVWLPNYYEQYFVTFMYNHTIEILRGVFYVNF